MAATGATKALLTIPEGSTYIRELIEKVRHRSNEVKLARTLRVAIQDGHWTDVMRCVQQSKTSKIDLGRSAVVTELAHGLRSYPQQAQWSKSSISKALGRAKVLRVALDQQMEQKAPGAKDIRQNPIVLGTFLELAAVNAEKNGRADTDGAVKAAANRLLSIFEADESLIVEKWELPEPRQGRFDIVLDNIPVYHGLLLAERILGQKMPNATLAKRITDEYGAGLENVVEQLRSLGRDRQSFAGEAIWEWENCLR